MSVLDELVERARQRVEGLQQPKPASGRPGPSLRAAIAGRDKPSVIAEFKRCSPSAGSICPDADVVEQVQTYVRGGAAALSVLTEPSKFGGSFADLQQAVAAVDVPVLMKDFVVSPRQIELAVELGAGAVLLIVRCLEPEQLRDLHAAAATLGIDALVECHDAREVDVAVSAGATLLGINHRNLSTLEVDFDGGRELLRAVPEGCVLVSESGVSRPDQVPALAGVADAVLIGTALMRSADPEGFLREAVS